MKGKIFNAQEVQSMLNGSKVMFSEVIKPPRHEIIQDSIYKGQLEAKGFQVYFENPRARWLGEDMPTGITVKCPYQVGQKIFVKEEFCKRVDQDTFEFLGSYHYRSSCEFDVYMMDGDGWTVLNKDGSERLAWKPAQHMKQEHSRLTLLIKEIKVERLASISCADYFAETGRRPINQMDLDCDTPDPRNDFKDYWNATHKKPEEKFEANPFVWKVEFEVINN